MPKKKRLPFSLEIGVYLCLLYGTTFSVYLNGDDFMYGSFSHQGIFSNVWKYYHTGNGRFWINIVDSVLLHFDRYLFAVIAPLLIFAFVFLLAKNIQLLVGNPIDKRSEQNLIRSGMVLFACLDIFCLRETTYWITGMMNYLFPAVIFLLAYYCFQFSRTGKGRGLFLVLYYPICFFASSSVEQFALMFVGMMTLHHGFDLSWKKKIPLYEWFAYAISILGLAFLLLAPGNFVRVNGQVMPSFISNLWTLVYQNTVDSVALPYLMSISALSFCKSSSCLSKASALFYKLAPVGILAVLCSPAATKAIVLLALLVIWLLHILPALKILYRQYNPPAFFLVFVGIGSQIMLLVSAVWGYRCMFSMYMVYMLIILMLLYDENESNQWFVLSIGIATAIHPALALCLWLTALIFRSNSFKASFVPATVYICTIASLLTTLYGYKSNVPAYRKNISATQAQKDVIVLESLPNSDYSWYQIPLSKFHEKWYKIYYRVEESEIVYLDTME